MPTINLDYTLEVKSGDDFIGTITDSTTYTSPARLAGAFYITGSKILTDGTVEEALVFDAYDEEVDTEYTFTIPKDGWHQFIGVFIPDYDNGANYNQHEAVYSGGITYKSISVAQITAIAPPNVSNWVAVSDPTTLAENDGTSTESPNLSFQVYERIIYPNAKTFSGSSAASAASGGCSDCERSEDVLTYEQANLNVDALNNYDYRGQYAQGEVLARASDELIAQSE